MDKLFYKTYVPWSQKKEIRIRKIEKITLNRNI